jgi:hypothetical protein
MIVFVLMGGGQKPCICSGSLSHLKLLVVFLGLAVVYPGHTATGSISFRLRVRLLLECADSTIHVSSVQDIFFVCGILPALVDFSLGVCGQVCFRLEPFCALDAVELSQTRQIFLMLCFLVFLQMLLLVDVVVDLVEIARVTASLFLRVLTADGRHRGFLLRSEGVVRVGMVKRWSISRSCRGHAKLSSTRLLRKLMQPAWNF